MQQATGQGGQRTIIITAAGAAIVSLVWFVVSMNVATTLIFALPIGGVGSLLGYRLATQIRRERTAPYRPSPPVAPDSAPETTGEPRLK